MSDGRYLLLIALLVAILWYILGLWKELGIAEQRFDRLEALIKKQSAPDKPDD